MNGVASARLWTIQKHVHARDIAVNESERLHRAFGRFKISAAEQDVHVLRISYGRPINSCYPRGYRIVFSDGVWNLGGLECRYRTQKSISHALHSLHHPIQQRRL